MKLKDWFDSNVESSEMFGAYSSSKLENLHVIGSCGECKHFRQPSCSEGGDLNDYRRPFLVTDFKHDDFGCKHWDSNKL